jgi:hypothetical protein
VDISRGDRLRGNGVNLHRGSELDTRLVSHPFYNREVLVIVFLKHRSLDLALQVHVLYVESLNVVHTLFCMTCGIYVIFD